jgi:hypothetical protein
VQRKRLLIVMAALGAAILFYVGATLPPRPVRVSLDGLDPVLTARTVRGAYHIHTDRSDGADPKAVVAAAAARAGLAFAIFTDHGDGTRQPDPPAYIDGVLCLDAVEISTNGGHYVALGLPPAPYPLGGEAAAVVEDVERLGGFGIVAHPDHPRPALAWSDSDAPVDGLEWINIDAEWRTEPALALARVIAHYLVRPAPAIATILDRPDATIARWDDMNRTRRVVALAAVDAHGGGGRGASERDEPSVAVGPTYEASFRTLTNRVVLDSPFTGDAARDAAQLLAAIRAGRVYSVVDALAPDVLVAMDGDQPVVQSRLPDGAEAVLVEEGSASRLEIRLAGSAGDPPVPWVLTNWLRTPTPLSNPEPAPAGDAAEPLAAGPWRVEQSPGSSADVQQADGGFDLRFQLAAGERVSQFAAAAADLTGARVDGIFFEGSADRPLRVSVQLRFPPADERWGTSVYLDATPRTVFVPLAAMVAADAPRGTAPPAGAARSLLFVVDLVNAKPGDSGSLTVRNLRVTR